MREGVVLFKNVRLGSSVGEQAKHKFHGEACALDHRFADHDVGIENDAFEKLLVLHGLCSYAACCSTSTRTRMPARDSMLMSLSTLKRPMSPFIKLLMRGCVS